MISLVLVVFLQLERIPDNGFEFREGKPAHIYRKGLIFLQYPFIPYYIILDAKKHRIGKI